MKGLLGNLGWLPGRYGVENFPDSELGRCLENQIKPRQNFKERTG